jgi:hypothetical protein
MTILETRKESVAIEELADRAAKKGENMVAILQLVQEDFIKHDMELYERRPRTHSWICVRCYM